MYAWNGWIMHVIDAWAIKNIAFTYKSLIISIKDLSMTSKSLFLKKKVSIQARAKSFLKEKSFENKQKNGKV